MAQHMLSNDTSRAAGMQGHPQSLDDMTDGQIEERFYQSVARAFLIYAFFCQLPDIMGGWWRWALVSPDGVAPSWMVGVSACVNLPLHHKVQKFSSGIGSHGWSRKKGHTMVVCVCWGTGLWTRKD